MVAIWLAAAGVLAAVQTAKTVRKRHRLRHVPSIGDEVPVLGRMKSLKDANLGFVHHAWRAAQEVGDAQDVDFVKFTMLGKTMVIAVSPEAVNCILKRQAWTPKYQPLYVLFQWLGAKTVSFVNEDTPQEHARLRKAFSQFFTSENIDSMLGQLSEHIRVVCDDRERQAGLGAGSVTTDVKQEMTCIVDKVVRQVLFETDVTVDTNAMEKQMRVANGMVLNPLQSLLVPRGLHPLYYTRYRRGWRTSYSKWVQITKEIYDRPMDEQSDRFWVCLRRAYPDALTNKWQWERAVTHALAFHFAACETTANSTAFTLTALALDQRSMHKLEAELAEAGLLVGDGEAAARQPTVEDLSQLRFLNAVFHEGLRLFSPAVSGSTRHLAHPVATKSQGTLPKGTPVIVPTYSVHHSTRAWGYDAHMWRPDRWLEGRSVTANKLDSNGLKRHIPFSDGPQNCIGSHLATLEVKLSLVMFISRFRITASRELGARTVAELHDNATTFITLHQQGGLPLTLEPRSSGGSASDTTTSDD